MSAGPLPGASDRRALPLRNAMLLLGRRPLDLRPGRFTLHVFRDLVVGRVAMVLSCGALDARAPLLSRVHSSCLTSECLMGCDCDCAGQLEDALLRIAARGRGALVYLMQEGRGAGLSAKARDRMLVQASGSRLTTFDAYAEMGLPPDLRRYESVASMLAMLGVRGPLRLMTNNPEKVAAVAHALAAEKLEIDGTEPVAGAHSAWNRDYLRAKRSAGHVLERLETAAGARPPERVRAFAPVPHAEDPERLVTASYFLPIALPPSPSYSSSTPPGPAAAAVFTRDERASSVDWFRVSVLVERASGRESIVLSRGDGSDPATIRLPGPRDWIALTLLDRLPVREAAGREDLAAALVRIREGGEGRVGVVWDEATFAAADRLPALPGDDVDAG